MADIVNIFGNTTVQIIFEKNDGDLSYRDALYFTLEEYEALSEQDIENIKDQRYNDWLVIITPPDE